MSWGQRAKSPGWAAFDLRQKQKHDPEAKVSAEPFPSLPTSIPSLQPCSSHVRTTSSEKPFTSAVLPSVSFPARFVDKQSISSYATSEAGNSRRFIAGNDCQGMEPGGASRRLKLMYSWADDSLIEDILAAVDNDFEKASSSLKAMVSDDSWEEHNNPDLAVSQSNLQFLIPEGKTLQSNMISSSKTTDPSEPTSISVSCIGDGDSSTEEYNRASDEQLLTGSPSTNFIPGQSTTGAPLEPEWEEDDVYFNHRKDAIKIIRAASRHSKAAANSFMRGDHLSARHYSQKAQEEWEAAEKLHQKAANEILRIRNDKNGIWKLDLHGLHAVEAVQALKDRLSVIETHAGSSGSAYSGNAAKNTEVQHGIPSGVDGPLIRQRPVSLEVITGVGNHSRGEAAIPAAVKGFLIDNGYRHEEARPGLIMVRPKFRHR